MFVDDKQNGHGIEEWRDGAKYEGSYRDGQKHGKGKFIWEDQSYYDGEFVNNEMSG